MSTPLETILLLGNYRPSLPIVRTLGPAGHTIIVGSTEPTAVEWSRHVSEVWRHPVLSGRGEIFIESLRLYLQQRPEISLIIPVSEYYTEHLLALRDTIDRPLLTVPPALSKLCGDKGKMATIARELGIAQQPFAAVDNWNALVEQAQEIGFPLVIRPNDDLVHLDKAFFLDHLDHLKRVFPAWPKNFKSLLLQAHANGKRYNRYFIAYEGKILRYLDIITERTDRVDGSGFGVDGISVAPLSILDEPSSHLLQHLNFSGIGNLQYLVDVESGDVSFLEINARLGGNYAFTHFCGLDQVNSWLDIFRGRPLEAWSAPFNYPEGKRFAWLYGDTIGFVRGLNRGELSVSKALKWLAQMSLTMLRANHHLTLDWRDPKPSLRLSGSLALILVTFVLGAGIRKIRRLREFILS